MLVHHNDIKRVWFADVCSICVAAAASTPRDCLGYEPLRWMDDDDECHSNPRRRRQFAKEYRFLSVSTTKILAEHLYKRQRRHHGCENGLELKQIHQTLIIKQNNLVV